MHTHTHTYPHKTNLHTVPGNVWSVGTSEQAIVACWVYYIFCSTTTRSPLERVQSIARVLVIFHSMWWGPLVMANAPLPAPFRGHPVRLLSLDPRVHVQPCLETFQCDVMTRVLAGNVRLRCAVTAAADDWRMIDGNCMGALNHQRCIIIISSEASRVRPVFPQQQAAHNVHHPSPSPDVRAVAVSNIPPWRNHCRP